MTLEFKILCPGCGLPLLIEAIISPGRYDNSNIKCTVCSALISIRAIKY